MRSSVKDYEGAKWILHKGNRIMIKREQFEKWLDNQANCIIMNTNGENGIDIYVTYELFAKKRNSDTYYDNIYKGWYIMTI